MRKTWSVISKHPQRDARRGRWCLLPRPSPTFSSAVAAKSLLGGLYPMARTPLKNGREKSCPPTLGDLRLKKSENPLA